MLTELYVEALQIDDELADFVWDYKNTGLIPDEIVARA